ncbi:MAG: ABC transporter permease [Candidatus Microsaccharimonas sossegonensis]|uniref:Cell division protein FtsX n=1 Tax=Candidatus Microsaccharimonas sossegonensis TaxID=2506948 RepID=A0A4Q0AHU5_9BACT|nr:MAG: ABC transporter permease [Candidatus Microsaccharimonas sossegonensis]
MAKGKKKLDSKTYAKQKRHHRQWTTFIRMIRYGVNNFSRNAWLTIAATAVMTITLFVIFTSVVSRNVLTDTLTSLRDNVSMSIYMKTDATEVDVNQVASDLRKESSVLAVNVTSPEQARTQYAQSIKNDAQSLTILKEATNKFPWTLSIKVRDINNTTQLANFVKTNKTYLANQDPQRQPSFAGPRRAAIENIGNAATFAQNVGIIISAVFVVVSTLIIFNTIRMAIFNRREEIQMMKLIGAERAFIRGPFVVEAIVYGFFAALFATALGGGILILAAPGLQQYFTIQPTIDTLTFYAGFVLLAMILIGAFIGIISSLMATRRYLKL